MKLTFEHGLDDFRWDKDHQPAPNKEYRDTGIQFWLDGQLLQAIADEGNPAACQLMTWINEKMILDHMTRSEIRAILRRNPARLPDGIEIGGG